MSSCQPPLSSTHRPAAVSPHDLLFSSHVVASPATHLLVRMVFALFAVVVVVYSAVEYFYFGPGYFAYYTHWNFLFLTVYFLSYLVSASYGIASNTARTLASAQYLVLETVCTQALFLDVVFWTLVYPLMEDPPRVGLSTVAMHGVNLLMSLADLLVLSQVRFRRRDIWLSALICTVYTCFSFIFHAIHGYWVYPFLDTSNRLWPLMYFIVILWLVLSYALCALCALVRDRIIVRRKHAQEQQLRLVAHETTPMLAKVL